MPVQSSLASILSIRFNFGVPLEDIFPPDDIHPRLKYLLKKAFEACIPYDFNIANILRYGQGTLKEKLQLKDKLVSALDYRIITGSCAPGAYFWVLRHFFGLLPLPVCPKYTKGIQFEWASLAEECKSLLKHHDENQKGFLDYDIAQNINMLPIENVIMLSIMILFLRKLAVKKSKFKGRQKYDRVALKTLCEYFSTSMFVRPFRPGGFQKCEYKPLLLYLILRWHHISQHCHNIGHPTQFSEDEIVNHLKLPNVSNKNLGTQTTLLSNAFFKPEVITICKNIPYLVNFCNKYLKDSGCQTELDINGNVDVDSECKDISAGTNTSVGKNAYKLSYIKEVLDEDGTENDSQKNEHMDDSEHEDMYETAKEFAFTSIVDQDNEENWNDVIKSTKATVRRVEGSFIYDDYDTFKEEDFNQVAKSQSSSFRDYLPAKFKPLPPSPEGIPQSSTPKQDHLGIIANGETSYVKFPEVLTTDDDASECSSEQEINMDDYEKETEFKAKPKSRENGQDKNGKLDEIKIADHAFKLEATSNKNKTSIAQNLFGDNSPVSVEGESSTQSLQDKNKIKKSPKYVLNTLRMSLKYLRTLTPKKSSFKKIESKIKYRRIRNGLGKSNTI